MRSLIFVAFFFTIPGVSFAQNWTMKSAYKEKQGVADLVSELTFSAGSQSITYMPDKPPYGVTFEKQMTLEGQEYFVTGWPQGASSMVFRVFLPAEKKEKVICQVTSRAESAELRIEKKRLHISVTADKRGKPIWVNCPRK